MQARSWVSLRLTTGATGATGATASLRLGKAERQARSLAPASLCGHRHPIHQQAASFPLVRFHGRRLSFRAPDFAFISLTCIRPYIAPSPSSPLRTLSARSSATPSRLNKSPPQHTPTPCPAYSRTSLSMTRRRSAARYAWKSSICRTRTSARVPAATRYVTSKTRQSRLESAWLTMHAPDMSVLLQQHQDDNERAVSRVSAPL